MADLNRGKFQGLDENAKNNYADSFVGATKVAEKVKKGGSETTSDGYVVDAIDIDWGGLKLTTISDQWSLGLQTESSTEQNAGKGDNTQGIHSTAYLLNKISNSFTQIYNQIGKDDTAKDSLRERIKTLETSVGQITSSTPEKLQEIKSYIDAINKELADPGAAGTLVTILDTLDGFDKNKKGDVKDYIDTHDQAILGSTADAATTYSVYGVRKYVDTTAKENLIGKSTDTTIDTHYGLKHILIGSYTDASTDDTIWGAKNYADNKVKELDATVDSTGGSHVAVQVVEEDGKVKTVTVTESNFDYEHITGADNKTLKETLENRDLAVSASLTELDGRLDKAVQASIIAEDGENVLVLSAIS